MATSDALITISSLPRPVRAIENVWIPMRDGARLAARIWLPENADAEPVPAILEYIPYRKRDFTRHRDSIMHPYVAANGYACVRVDLRGSGDSDGVLTDEYTQQELDDGCDVIAWLAAQPWCSGKVGMIGISWGGFNGLQIVPRAVVDDIRKGASQADFAKAGFKTLPGWSYRDMWWVSHDDHGVFEARGIHGQAIYIDPKAEMVIARFASYPLAANAHLDPTTLPAFRALAEHLMQ